MSKRKVNKYAEGGDWKSTISSMIPQSITGNTWGDNSNWEYVNKGIDLTADALALVPGWGWAASAALKGANFVANELGGSNINKSAVDGTKSQINSLSSQIGNSTSFDQLESNASALSNLNIDRDNYGTQGVFSDKLDRTVNSLSEAKTNALNGVADAAQNINKNNMNTLLQNAKAYGGGILSAEGPFSDDFSNGVDYIANGGSHEENPNEGVQVGVDPEGTPNLVEEGEVIFNDYVFSNRLKDPKTKKTFAEEAIKAQKESSERPNDPISKNGLYASMSKLAQKQERERMIKQAAERAAALKEFANGGNLFADGEWLRYAEPLGSAISEFINVFDKYEPERVADVNVATGVNHIGDRVEYKPIDRNYYTNQLAAQQAGTMSAIRNSASPSKYAAMLAADSNFGQQYGNFVNQADKENYQNYLNAATFNRGTNQFNAQLDAQAISNALQEAQINSQNRRFNSEQAFKNKQLRDAATGQNIGNIFTSIGNIGKEISARDWQKTLLDKGVLGPTNNGGSSPTNGASNTGATTETGKDEHQANGGRIARKKKRYLTF